MANPRVRKVADRIQVIVAEMLERRIKDPRLGFVTVTDVRMTGDNQNATIYWTVLDEESARDTAAALESAKGVLRSEVGKQLGMRTVPMLAFQRDALPETARALDELLARAREADAAVAAAREGKAPAGEADPYRKPRVVEDDDDLADLDDPDDAEDVGLADDRRPGEA